MVEWIFLYSQQTDFHSKKLGSYWNIKKWLKRKGWRRRRRKKFKFSKGRKNLLNSVFFFFIFFFILKNKLLSLLLSRCLCLSVVKRTLNLNSLFSRFLLLHSLALKILFPKKLFHLLKNIKVVAIWIIMFFLKFVASTRFISFIFLTPWIRRSSFCQRSLMMKVFWLRDDNQMLMRIIEWIFLFSSLEYCSSHCQPREKVTFTPQNFFLCLIRDEKGFFL